MNAKNMNCERVRLLLPALEHGELSPAEAREVERHLAECKDCRMEQAEISASTKSVADLRIAGGPSDAVLDNLKNAARDQVAHKQKAPRSSAIWKLAAAAALLVVCAVAFVMYRAATKPASNPTRDTYSQVGQQHPAPSEHPPQRSVDIQPSPELQNGDEANGNDQVAETQGPEQEEQTPQQSDEAEVTPAATQQIPATARRTMPRAPRRRVARTPATAAVEAAPENVEDEHLPDTEIRDKIKDVQQGLDSLADAPAYMSPARGWRDLDDAIDDVESELDSLKSRVNDRML